MLALCAGSAAESPLEVICKLLESAGKETPFQLMPTFVANCAGSGDVPKDAGAGAPTEPVQPVFVEKFATSGCELASGCEMATGCKMTSGWETALGEFVAGLLDAQPASPNMLIRTITERGGRKHLS